MIFDVAVAGLGGMGSAIAAQCASRGASTIGFDQFEPAHDLGASHGKSRMIRQAYFEDPAYVPLVLRAYELWRELERETGEELLRITGVLSIGAADSEIIAGTLRAADRHNLSVKAWSQQEVTKLYPSLQLLPDELAVFEPDGLSRRSGALNAAVWCLLLAWPVFVFFSSALAWVIAGFVKDEDEYQRRQRLWEDRRASR